MAWNDTPARSWSAEFFTHFRHAEQGCWIPTLCHFHTADDALIQARATLQRVLNADPGIYIAPDPINHVRAVASTEPVNAWLIERPDPHGAQR